MVEIKRPTFTTKLSSLCLASLNKLLRNKQEEVNKKLEQTAQLKKDKSQPEIKLNKTITELRKDLEELKKKYSKQGTLLDGEQTNNNKLTERLEQSSQKIEQLEVQPKELSSNDNQIELSSENKSLAQQVKSLTENNDQLARKKDQLILDKQELQNKCNELTKTHQAQLRQTNLLFDKQADSYEKIDFAGLYALLTRLSQAQPKTPESEEEDKPRPELAEDFEKEDWKQRR